MLILIHSTNQKKLLLHATGVMNLYEKVVFPQILVIITDGKKHFPHELFLQYCST